MGCSYQVDTEDKRRILIQNPLEKARLEALG
jgi:hypothetical protein